MAVSSMLNSPATPDYAQLIGSLGSIGAGLYGANAQGNNNNLAQRYAIAAGQLNPFDASTGAGGMSALYGPNGPTLNYGSLQSPYNGLTSLAGGNIGAAGGIGLPPGFGSALQGGFGQGANGLGSFNPAAAGLAGNTAFLGSANAAAAAGGGYSNQVAQQYNALKSLQSFGDTQNMNMLQSSLFGNGQLGSSSGGLQTRAFAQGLGQENAQDSLLAQQLGLQAQQSDTNTASALGATGQNLLSSAFGNFGNSAGLIPGVQGAVLGNGLNAISGAGNITGQGLGLFNAGLQGALGQNQASSRAGALTLGGATNLNASPMASMLSGLFGNLAPNGVGGGASALGGVLSSLKGLFGGSGTTPDPNYNFNGALSPVDSGNFTNPALQNLDFSNPDSLSIFQGDTSGAASFNGAGGQAASSQTFNQPTAVDGYFAENPATGAAPLPGQSAGGSSLGSIFGALGSGAGVASGLSRGGALGDAQAVASGAKLAGQVTGNGGLSSLAGNLGGALNVYSGLTSGTPIGVGQGLASAAGLAANSGAASALGASAGTVGALGAAATGVGAVLAIPGVVQGVASLFNSLFPQKGGDQNYANLLGAPHSGVQQRQVSSSPGGSTQFGLGSTQYLYNGNPVSLSNAQADQAWKLYQQGQSTGNYSAYQQFMKTTPTDPSRVFNPQGGVSGTAWGGGLAQAPFPVANQTPKPTGFGLG